MRWRVGTRGSDLALRQTRMVCHVLEQHLQGRESPQFEEIVIQTHAEKLPDQALTAGVWPSGGFVREIEQALTDGEIDFAVHSYKDLPSADPDGLVIAAVLERGPMHDCLIACDGSIAERLREALGTRHSALDARPRIGTSSPRRTSQLSRALNAEIVPLRGNVPTRLQKLHDESLDAVCLAAAGLDRLELDPPHRIDLPLERFPTAPAQGAIAVQVRRGSDIEQFMREIDHQPTRRLVTAERTFLAAISAGCQTPVAASAHTIYDRQLELHVQLFGAGDVCFDAHEIGNDPIVLAQALAKAALNEIEVT